MNPIHRLISKVRIRLAVHLAFFYTIRGLLVASIVGCLWIIATRLFPQLGDPAPVVGGCLIASAVLALCWTVWRYPSRVHTSLELDKRLGLNERVTSSLEMEGMEGPMVDALQHDVVRTVDSLSHKQVFPWISTHGLPWLSAAFLTAGLIYMFLPVYDLTGHKERIAEAKTNNAATAVAVERIEAIKNALPKLDIAKGEALSEMKLALGDMQRQLEMGEITEKQALARLSNLNDDLMAKRDALKTKHPKPNFAGDMKQFSIAKELAGALQKGNMGEAAEMAKALKKKLEKGDLTKKEKEKLKKELKALSEQLGGENSQLGQALAKAAAGMDSGDIQGALEAMKEMEMNLDDLASVMAQMEKMDQAMEKLDEWKQSSLGDSEFCRKCGSKLKKCDGKGGQCKSKGHSHSGECKSGTCSGGKKPGSGSGSGGGLGGPGQGQGNRLGDLPDVEVGFKPTKIPGPLTKGQILADIMQKASPELGEEATIESISGAFVQLQQETEQALTQEEIPDASRELVRQYFGSLDPDEEAQ